MPGSPFTGLVVPVESSAVDDRGADSARALSEVLDRPVRPVHVESGSDDMIAAGIVTAAAAGELIVMETDHANRWSGKESVAEHVLDRWVGATMLVGPRVERAGLGHGPIVVALDGSTDAERALTPAGELAEALTRGVVLARVVAPGLEPPAPGATDEAAVYLAGLATGALSDAVVATPVSNDPVSALAELASAEGAALIALSSHGDRQSKRSTISRTCTGLAAIATQPVLIIGPGNGA